jgi:hypothetical protein
MDEQDGTYNERGQNCMDSSCDEGRPWKGTNLVVLAVVRRRHGLAVIVAVGALRPVLALVEVAHQIVVDLRQAHTKHVSNHTTVASYAHRDVM